MKTKLRIYDDARRVPISYDKHLKKMGIRGGRIVPVFFQEYRDIYHLAIVTNGNNVPLSWGLVTKEGGYSKNKTIMLFTKFKYRKMGLGKMVYTALNKRHKRFSIYDDLANYKFFKKMGRVIRNPWYRNQMTND